VGDLLPFALRIYEVINQRNSMSYLRTEVDKFGFIFF
jgi:hypothetical protein